MIPVNIIGKIMAVFSDVLFMRRPAMTQNITVERILIPNTIIIVSPTSALELPEKQATITKSATAKQIPYFLLHLKWKKRESQIGTKILQSQKIIIFSYPES